MKDKKLQVFVSSTFLDLKEERQAAVEAILSAGHIPAGMELFSAGDESQLTVIKRWIDESDVYLLLLGGRYGSIEKKSAKSYTHLEYEYAVEQNKPLFSLVISDEALDAKVKEFGTSAIEKKNQKNLDKFRSVVLQNLVKFWDDTKDIKLAIYETLSEFTFRKELIGWVRNTHSVDTGFLAEEIARVSKENSDLREKLSSNNSEVETRYSGLTYFQLKSLLENDIITENEVESNLFNYLKNNGERLSQWTYIGHILEGNKLMKYKIVQTNNNDYYLFTEDGHNFYLKSLLDN